MIGSGYDLFYTVWCSNEHELYEMQSDPVQMNNLYPPDEESTNSTTTTTTTKIYNWETSKLIARLDALLLTLKSCAGSTCRRPWAALHPQGDVASLAQALDPRFDAFYAEGQEKVTFSACAPGYITEYEGALESRPFGGGGSNNNNNRIPELARWEDWT